MSLTAVVPALLFVGAVGQTGTQTGTEPQAAAAAPGPAASPVSVAAPSGDGKAAPAKHRHVRHAPGDPLESFNRKSFNGQQSIDRHVYRPVAFGYKHITPAPLRAALRHFFSNLSEPIVFLNYLLQLKPGKAIETAARFAINSSLGLGGTMDLAKGPGIRLPHRPNGLGDTLGYYGVKPGPYLFLPFVGPTTLRDLFGNTVDGALLAPTAGEPFDRLYYQLPRAILPGLDQRVEADSDLRALMVGAVDPYATLRSVYLQDRASEIRNLHSPRHNARASLELGDPLADPAGTNAGARGGIPELSDPMADPAAPTPSAQDKPPAPARPSTDPAFDDPLKDPAAKPSS